MKMVFGTGVGRGLRIDQVADHARVAEESGFSHFTVVDQQNLSRDMYVMMTIAALSTHRIKIGHGVTQPFTRHPSVTANATATIDELSGGRAFLGIGAGMNAVWTLGVKTRPMQELRETVEFVKKYTSGEESEFKGVKMHSAWIRRRLPVYMAASGPRSLQLAGELADGVMITAVHPVMVKWKVEQIEKGALKAGRDPAEIDIWARTQIYVANSKEEARREVAGYTATNSMGLYTFLFQRNSPEIDDLRQRLERAEPGLLEGLLQDIRPVRDVFDNYMNELTDAPHNELVTQRMIDFSMLTGKEEDICERIHALGGLGIRTVSSVLFGIIDKKGMMQEVGNKIMPHFRN